MRDEQAATAAQHAYWDSRRPRRALVTRVPAADGGTRPIIVPCTTKPISWQQARSIGQATARVLEGLPAWPDANMLAEINAELQKRVKRRMAAAKAPRESKLAQRLNKHHGDWWGTALADAIDRRADRMTPAYRKRKLRRTRRTKEKNV